MASVIKEFTVAAPPDFVWDAVRDVGAVHERLVPGLVTHVAVQAGERTVTFANGIQLRELIVDVDDTGRRLAYASVGGSSLHHNASMQVFPDSAGGSRIVWTTDVLPHERAAFVRQTVGLAAPLMTKTLEADYRKSTG